MEECVCFDGDVERGVAVRKKRHAIWEKNIAIWVKR
jgi:hypothetical protein